MRLARLMVALLVPGRKTHSLGYVQTRLDIAKDYPDQPSWTIWYGFGMDWQGISLLICSRLFNHRPDIDWWKCHSILVNETTKEFYHLTDLGAEYGEDIENTSFYPLLVVDIDAPTEVEIRSRHGAIVRSKEKVEWKDAFYWAINREKAGTFLCHDYTRLLTIAAIRSGQPTNSDN